MGNKCQTDHSTRNRAAAEAGAKVWLKWRSRRATEIAQAVEKSQVKDPARADYLHRLVIMNQSHEKPPPFDQPESLTRYHLIRSFSSVADLHSMRLETTAQLSLNAECFHVSPLVDLVFSDLIQHWDQFELNQPHLVAIELVFESTPLLLLCRDPLPLSCPVSQFKMLRLDLSSMPASLYLTNK